MLIRDSTSGRRALAPASDASGSNAGAAALASSPDLDPKALQQLRDLDPTGAGHLMERIADAFEISVTRLLPQLQAAREAAEASTVRYVAHTLRSSSASVGAVRMSRMCSELEAAALQGWSDDMHEDIAALAGETAAVLNALKRTLDKAP